MVRWWRWHAACSVQHTVGLQADGRVRVWGGNDFGQRNVPVGLPPIIAVSSSGGHVLALTTDGKVRAWGTNVYGESVVPWSLPTVVAIAAGQGHSVAVLENGALRCWGNNLYGQSTVPYAGGELASLLADWGEGGSEWDLRGDGVVLGDDLAELLGGWSSAFGRGSAMGPVIAVSASVHTVVVSVP